MWCFANLGLMKFVSVLTRLEYVEAFLYCKVASTSQSRLKAHAGFFRLSMKGKLDVYLL